ncbi:MAG: tripartite tricarboxylate transporter permease, partial [Alphaproteobacteria bacterium]
MEAVGGLLTGFGIIVTLDNLFVCFLGSLIGTLVGVLPGVGPLAALALLLPITFTMTPVGGMVMLASIFYGAMYGGSTTSILLNIPGEAASVVTCLDGHQMAKQGRAGAALGIAAIGSFVAGTLGVIVMTFFAPTIATVAIRFGPPENFALMVLGIVCTLFMITGSPVKGALMVALGFLTAAVGIDVVNGRERFTFG